MSSAWPCVLPRTCGEGQLFTAHSVHSRVMLYQAVGRGSPLKQLRIRGYGRAWAELGLLLMRNAEKDAGGFWGRRPTGLGKRLYLAATKTFLSQGSLYGGSREERKITYANMLWWTGWETPSTGPTALRPSMPCSPGLESVGGLGDQIEISAMG